MSTISFTVVGTPEPQGNKTGFVSKSTGKIAMREGRSPDANARFKSWRAEVVDAAAAVAPPEPLAGPVNVSLQFRFLPVASDPWRTHHVSSPDIDKLARSVLDALKVARVVVDDSRVCGLSVDKMYCAAGEMPGVDVFVYDLAPLEAVLRRGKKQAARAARKGVVA